MYTHLPKGRFKYYEKGSLFITLPCNGSFDAYRLRFVIVRKQGWCFNAYQVTSEMESGWFQHEGTA
jgi:hypothetical protein